MQMMQSYIIMKKNYTVVKVHVHENIHLVLVQTT